jgi:hypothetical protein
VLQIILIDHRNITQVGGKQQAWELNNIHHNNSNNSKPLLLAVVMQDLIKGKIMAETTTISSKPEDFVSNGTAYTHKWNPRTVTDQGEGSWSIIPKEDGLLTSSQVAQPAPEVINTSSPAFLAAMQSNANRVSTSGENGLMSSDPLTYFTSSQQPAPTSVMGMFPEVDAMQRALYQQKQNEAMQAQAMQYAQLDPMARAQYSLYLGGQQLGGAIGGALGAKDPQLQMIGLTQQILKELDPSNPNQQLQIAQKYAQVAPDLAMRIADNARSSLVKIAQANKERQTSVAPRVQESQRAGIITSAIRQYKALPQTPEVVQAIETLQSELDFLKPKAEATPDKIQVAERIARNKGFTQGSEEFNKEVAKQLERPEKDTQIEQLQSYRDQLINSKAPASKIAEVDAVIKSLGEGTAPKIIMPGQPVAPKDWLAFSSQISKDPIMDRTSTVISDAPSAIETIRMSTTNDIAAASLPGALAKLTGEGKNMSNADISRYARTGGLTDRVAQDVVGFFTGQRTSVTKEQAERFATAVYRGALLERKKFIQDQAEQAGYKDTPNYAIAIRQLDDQLAKFKLIKPSEQTKESLPKATTEVDTEKEKRYQQYKKDQLGANK